MSHFARFRSWWKWVVKRRQLESDMDAELLFHLQKCAEDLVRAGVPEAEAIRRARIALGAVESHKNAMRRSVGIRWRDDLWRDLRCGVRMLGKSPTFTLVIILTLALSIGANSAIFSVIDGVLLKPLPYPQAERIARVFYHSSEYAKFPMNPWDFLDFRAQNRSFENFAMYTHADIQLSSTGGDPVKLSAFRISSGYFRVLGVQPARGREFDFSEERPETGT
jgi:MacB-like periplasmic core domain